MPICFLQFPLKVILGIRKHCLISLHNACYRLSIAHPSHDNRPINELFKLKPLSERHDISNCCFIQGLINGHVDVPNLLEWLGIRIPGKIGSQRFFSTYHLAKTTPPKMHIKIMFISINHSLFRI